MSSHGDPWRYGAWRYAVLVGDAADGPERAGQRAYFDQWVARIRAMDDLTEALMEAQHLVRAEHEFRCEATELRGELARRIHDTCGLSISQVGKLLGVSKGTADRILRRAGGFGR
jgi:ActR/RegA family two-component response regulator